MQAAKTDFNALLVFAAVAETGGFTAAAERLGVTKAKISQDISRLEQQLSARLFNRTTRRVVLTDTGSALYDQCVPLLRQVEIATAQLTDDSAILRGKLRITTTVDHAVQSLSGAIAQFNALHPNVNIDLLTGDQVIDLVKDNVDLAIRIGWLRDSSLRALKLRDFSQYVVASPEYWQQQGLPQHPDELAAHRWLTLSRLATPLTWSFTQAGQDDCTVRMQSHLRVDTATVLRALLEAGAGVSVLDELSSAEALRSGRLQRVLTDWHLPRGGVYAVYPPGPHVPAVVRAFVEFYREYLQR